ncbi:MAG: arginine--tRNA ligase [Armatimonadota bacterium]
MIQDNVSEKIKEILGVEEVPFNIPPSRDFGDFSTAVCLAQAKIQKKPPIQIAEDVKNQLDNINIEFIKEIIVTPPGYLNFKIDHRAYVKAIIDRVHTQKENYGKENIGNNTKILVEHTNVNPNKAMHIGHLRNAIIGDSIVRILRKLGYNVEACNYIDDTGVQVADVVVAMLYMDAPVYDGKSDDFSQIWAKVDPNMPFDYWCWDIYSRVANEFDTNPELMAKRAEVLHEVESQAGPVAKFAKEVATKIVYAHLKTVSRLNVYYNLLNWESDIFLRGFWKTAFELLKEAGVITLETEGPNIGCWVVKFGKGVYETEDGIKSEDKVLVRSNGTVTYTGKDIAYQMWKFGVLGKDFLYKKWGMQPNGEELWTTSPDGEVRNNFGKADKVINVIDVRQSYTQQIVYDCLNKLGYEKESENSIHLGYEVVVLSNAAARELGVDVDPEDSGIQAMSGRKGLGVKGDDLLDIMVKKLANKVAKEENAHILASAAIRYFMSRISTGKMIVFDFDEALRTTGDTGVYCQYAHARACSILKKSEIENFDNIEVPEKVTQPEEELIKKIASMQNYLKKAGEELSPAPMAHYAFELATAFTEYYETPDPEAEKQVPFIKIEDPVLKRYRLALVDTFRQTMANCLDCLGIIPLERI